MVNNMDEQTQMLLAMQQGQQAPGILSNPQASPGILDRLNARQDSGPIYDSMLQAGAAMMGGRNLRESLAGGIGAFGNTYDATLKRKKEEAKENQPKVTPLANGAFSLISFKDGTTKIVKNDQVAQYNADMETSRQQAAIERQAAAIQMASGAAQQKQDAKTSAEARPVLNEVTSMLDRYGQAKQIIAKQGLKAQVAGLLPGVAGFFGSDAAADNKFLQGLVVDETLLNTAKTKGAISEKEMALFKSPMPSLGDDREKVWKPWIEEREKVLKKLQAFHASEAARGGDVSGLPETPTPANFPTISPQEQAGRDQKAIQMLTEIINSPQASPADRQQARDDLAALQKLRPAPPQQPQVARASLPAGAKQAPDGNYYIQKNGKYYRVDQ